MPSPTRRTADVHTLLFTLPLLLTLSCNGPETAEPKPGLMERHPIPERELILHYDRPATFFEEALPIGNGRIGAMVYGAVEGEERLSLNDITLWTGEPDRGAAHPDLVLTGLDGSRAEALQAVREALENEDYRAADSLQMGLQGHYSETYQPLGDLLIRHIAAPGNAPVTAPVQATAITGYRRELDLRTAIARVSCEQDGMPYSAEYFASAPDSVIVIRLSCEAGIDADLSLRTPHAHSLSVSADAITLDGYLRYHAYPDYYKGPMIPGAPYQDPNRGIHFRTILSVAQEGGTATAADSLLELRGCKEVELRLVNATSFNGFDRDPVREGKPYQELAEANAARTKAMSVETLRERHLADYRSLFGRLELDLGETPDSVRVLPTDEQLLRYTDLGEANPELEVLYAQMGRYLLIASSRTEGVPANLQGLWNERMDPPWSSNYTLNINLEENYWPAETAALSELHLPLLGFIRNLSVNGAEAARRIYGSERGWNAGQNSDLWAMACPVGLGVGDPDWANWTMGGAWLATHIWEHWLFTRDRDFLEAYEPVLRKAALFCLDYFVEKDGELITSPGTSPENYYRTPAGYFGATLYGCTADLALSRECLLDAIAAAKELQGKNPQDAEAQERAVFIAEAEAALERLHGYRIGADGRLQEWYYDWRDWDPKHRHQSHLTGLYPGHHLSPAKDSLLAAAALKTLEVRGFETTGWSCGWRINLYARLGEGETAYRMYRRLLRYVSPDRYRGPGRRRGGGTYPNLLDAHSPFQIDGNFGGCAGVLEMLIGSDAETVTPLPALPAAWPNGRLCGVRTRTGQAAYLEWADGKLVELDLE